MRQLRDFSIETLFDGVSGEEHILRSSPRAGYRRDITPSRDDDGEAKAIMATEMNFARAIHQVYSMRLHGYFNIGRAPDRH